MTILVVIEGGPYVQLDNQSMQTVNAKRKSLLTAGQIAANCSVKKSLRTSTTVLDRDLFAAQQIETWMYRNTQRISHQRCILHNQTNKLVVVRSRQMRRILFSQRPGIPFALFVTHPLQHDNRNDATRRKVAACKCEFGRHAMAEQHCSR